MTGADWEERWRGAEPLPDFARRVVEELERREQQGGEVVGFARAIPRRRHKPLVLLGLAALLGAGAAAASLGGSGRAKLADVGQETAPTVKAAVSAPRLELVSLPAPMEPGRPSLSPPARAPASSAKVAEPAPALPLGSVPIHYPACHCSSGAVVCSCVD